MNRNQALYKFWSGFGIPAYEENSVPDNAKLPYITYMDQIGYMGDINLLTASIWDYDMPEQNNWSYVIEKANAIGEYIGQGGTTFRYEDGLMWVTRGTPFGQRMSDPTDDRIRRMILNIQVEFIED